MVPADQQPGSTHSDPGTGAPRLVLEVSEAWPDEQQPVFWLTQPETTIGSAESCDIVLPGLEARHALVRRDDSDEYLLTSIGPEARVHGAVVTDSAVLRTGARIALGEHALAYYREEYADHGRPYGGRVGGEAGHQSDQPDPRTHEGSAESH